MAAVHVPCSMFSECGRRPGRWSSTSAFHVPRSTFHEKKNGVQRQFPQQLFPSAIPKGCTLGLRREVVEDLAETLNKEKSTPSPPKSADALDKPLGEKERTTLLVIIDALAKKAKIAASMERSVAMEE